MGIYYLSADGHDGNDGLTPETAWQTISHANQAMHPGDTLLFRRGDTFFGAVRPPRNASYGAYGEGGKPVISQYKTVLPGKWENCGENLWRIDLSDTCNFTGNIHDMDANAGFLLIDGQVHAVKRFAREDLAAQWEFYSGDTDMILWSETDPSAHEISIACNIRCVTFADGLRVENLIFDGTGGHGISGTVRGAYVGNCEFRNIGGSRLVGYPNPTTRYGNGVECWSNSANVIVENCVFTGIYDVAITMQGNGVRTGWENIILRNNIMYNCQQAFEIWSSFDENYPGTGFKNCRFENNLCLDSGYCWGYDVRPNKGVSCDLLLYHLECPACDVTVTGNVFSGARLCAVYKSGGCTQIPEGYRITGNTFILSEGEILCGRGRESDEEYNQFYARIAAENRILRR